MERTIRGHRATWLRARMPMLIAMVLASSLMVSSQASTRAEHGHTVEYGDTLSHIAVNYGFTVDELVLLNGIDDPNVIFPGDQIAFGAHGNSSEPVAVASTTGATPVVEDEWVDESDDVAVDQGAPQEWPPYVEQWYIRELLIDAAHRYGWDPTLIMAQAWQESSWAQDEISWTGAIGVLQIMPATAAEMEDWYFQRDMDVFMSVEDNIEMGVAYLSVLYEETGSVELALASYYQGWWSVQNDGFFPDTNEYVERIFMFQEMFANGELP